MSRRSPAVAVLISLFTLLALWLPADLRAQTAPTPLPAGITAGPTAEGISEFRLANGLKVLLFPDQSKDLTLVNVTYLVGSKHENYGETGMAHLLEHLLFKGSPRHPKAWAEFTRRGLRANGSTWLDRTNYFASFTANEDNLRWYLGWQADAMVNSFIARRDLDTEMTVVRNEMEMGENSPGRVLLQQTMAAMYQWHNYGKSTIGARSDVEQSVEFDEQSPLVVLDVAVAMPAHRRRRLSSRPWQTVLALDLREVAVLQCRAGALRNVGEHCLSEPSTRVATPDGQRRQQAVSGGQPCLDGVGQVRNLVDLP